MTTWQLVKKRTATQGRGEVSRSEDGTLYRRTGGPDVLAEAELLHVLTTLQYPVPNLVDYGDLPGGGYFFTERSVGEQSLHELALADTEHDGTVSDATIDAAADISSRLLLAQAETSWPGAPAQLRKWFEKAAFAKDVFVENPDLNTDRTHHAIDQALGRLAGLPLCESHLDYGLPNAFPGGVIDWQHHAPAPLGYDVYPMLDIAAFKGGNRGYTFTGAQRARYVQALDERTEHLTGGLPFSTYLGDFLLVKCFFFLALMKPSDPAARPDKHIKWLYRRALFEKGLQQYEADHRIDTGTFPTLADFEAAHRAGAATGPAPDGP